MADDITRVTGWRIARDRYSKYESGTLPVGKVVLRHFIDYWQTRGVDGPDSLTPREETPVPDLASAILALTGELTAMRLEREAWRRGVVGVLRSYEAGQVPEELLDALAPLLPGDAQPAQRR